MKWVSALIALTLLVGGAYLYLRASRVPDEYAYQPLSRDQRKQAADDFYNHLARFNNHAQDTQPFRWSLSEDRINRYLASMEEIAAIRPGHQAGSVLDALHEAGVADPAVALEDGRLRLMLRLTEYDKIVSLTLAMEFTSDRRLRVKLIETAIGTLAVPETLVRDRLTALRASLARGAGDGDAPDDDPTAQAVSVLATILQAIDQEPITPVGTWDQRRIRVHNITITPEKITLHVHRLTEDDTPPKLN